MNYTTLEQIKASSPCGYGWEKLLTSLGKTKADNEPVSLLYILNSNGLADALWALRCSDASQRDMRLYAVWCARKVQYLITDQQSLDALDVAERHAGGNATDKELSAARNAAEVVAVAATGIVAAFAAKAAAAFAAKAGASKDAQKERFIEVFCQENKDE